MFVPKPEWLDNIGDIEMAITPEQLAKSGTEHGLQAAVFCWANNSGIPELKWLFAIPNGFFGSASQKGKMKAEGLKNGVADVMLPIVSPRGEPGLFIELKIEQHRRQKNGGLSEDQKAFKEFVVAQGYKFVVCYSWIEAKDAILEYLGKM